MSEVFIGTNWGTKGEHRIKMSRADVLNGAHDLLMGKPAPGDSGMERAGWRATVKRGLWKLAEEVQNRFA